MEVPTHIILDTPTRSSREGNNHGSNFRIQNNNNSEINLRDNENIEFLDGNNELLSLLKFHSLCSFLARCQSYFLSSWINWTYASCISFLGGYSGLNILGAFHNSINSELILLNSDTEDINQIILLNHKNAPLAMMKLLCEVMVTFVTALIICKISLSLVVDLMVNLIESTLVLISLLIILKMLIYFVLKDNTTSAVSVNMTNESNSEEKANNEDYQKASCVLKLRKLFKELLPHLRSTQGQVINGYTEDCCNSNIGRIEDYHNDNTRQKTRNEALHESDTEKNCFIQGHLHYQKEDNNKGDHESYPGYQRSRCIVCLENEVKVALVPCGHFCLCVSCAQRTSENDCPICREAVVFQQFIY